MKKKEQIIAQIKATEAKELAKIAAQKAAKAAEDLAMKQKRAHERAIQERDLA